MIPIKIKDLIKIVDGTIVCQGDKEEIFNICIDSRLVSEGSLFIPLRGEKFDGHDFIENAFNAGAVAVLTERDDVVDVKNTLIRVRNNLNAIHKITKYYRSIVKIPIIALTGSSGKTTTKDIVYSILKQKYNVLKTKGNQNNHLGVPLTMFRIGEYHDIAVIEMGMNHLGEISKLVNIVFPDISVITNIGVTHIENLKSKDNIFKAKKEIFETLNENKIALVNGNDEYLKNIDNTKFKLIKYGIEGEKLDIVARNIKSSLSGISFEIYADGVMESYNFKLPGRHNVFNCLVGIYIGKLFKLNKEFIQKGLDEYIPSENRMDIRDIKNMKVINDSYNANPDSIKAALNVLVDYKMKNGRAIAILGDMLEMGNKANEFHREIGEYLSQLKEIDVLLAVGKHAKYYLEGAVQNKMEKDRCIHFNNTNEASEYLSKIVKDNDSILIKGSRGMKMEEILYTLERS
ncbi:MAG: UDP-N-acetylmuramoyl-tripeptide--D-alanyl-D-alanine ligase [Eubacteriaceae bacterium]